jgi:hypothetical protein
VASEGTEKRLVWEQQWRVPAAAAALVGGLLLMAGSFWRFSLLTGPPRVGLLRSLDRAAAPGPIGRLPSLRVQAYEFYDDRATGVLASSVLSALGSFALAGALTYLVVATRNRRPDLPAPILYLPAVGGIAQGLSSVLATLGTNQTIHEFLSGPRTVAAADEIGAGGLSTLAQLLSIGSLVLALGIVLVCINAMRVGLLTRFLGITGIFAGALLVLPLNPLPVILSFWMVLLSVLFVQRWPNGQPPAWRSGRAEPWPPSAGARRRQAAIGGRRAAPAPEPEEERVPAGAAAPGARRRKRKKRS